MNEHRPAQSGRSVMVPLRLLNTLRTAAISAPCYCDNYGPLCWRCKALRHAEYLASDSSGSSRSLTRMGEWIREHRFVPSPLEALFLLVRAGRSRQRGAADDSHGQGADSGRGAHQRRESASGETAGGRLLTATCPVCGGVRS